VTVPVMVKSVTASGPGQYKCPGASSPTSSSIAFGGSSTGGGSLSIAGGYAVTGIIQKVTGTFTPTNSGPVGTYTANGVEQINLCPGAGPFTNAPFTITGLCGIGTITFSGAKGDTGQYTVNSICR
jgi:hypothetical protein